MVLKLLFSLVIVGMLPAFGVFTTFGVLPAFGVFGSGGLLRGLIGGRLFCRFGILFFSLATAAAGPYG